MKHLDRSEIRAARIAASVSVLLFLLIATWMRPWHMFDRGQFTSDFYDVQARALSNGRLSVPPSIAALEGFLINGKTYLYFGLGPSLLRLPFASWTTALDGRLTLASQLLAVTVLSLSTSHLAGRARSILRISQHKSSPMLIGTAGVAAPMLTPILFLASKQVVYHEAEIWGVAGAVAGFNFVLKWWDDRSARNLGLAFVACALAISCRPTSGAAPALMLGLCGLLLLRHRARQGLTVLATSGLSTLGFSSVNWIKFGTLFGVPFDKQVFSTFDKARQAALAANDGGLFGLKFIPTNAARYFSPWAVNPTRLFPFSTWASPARPIGQVVFDTIDLSGSIITSAPALFLLSLVGLCQLIRQHRRSIWWTLAAASTIAALPTFTISFLAHRYLSDLVPLVVVLAIPGMWFFASSAPRWRASIRNCAMTCVMALVTIGFAGQLGLTFLTQAFSTMTTDADPTRALAFTKFQYDVDRRLFGTPPPHVYLEERSTGVQHTFGDLLIVGDCLGLYRFNGLSWLDLERKATDNSDAVGSRRFVVTVPAPGVMAPLVSGDDWTIKLVRHMGSFAVEYTNGLGEIRTSKKFEIQDHTVTLDIAVDPQTQSATVSLGNRNILNETWQPLRSARLAGPWKLTRVDAPFCESLRRELAGNP